MIRRLRGLYILVLAVGLLSTGATWAATQVHTAMFPGPASTNYQLTDWNTTLTVPQFNPALGTLTAVEVYFESAIQTDMTLDNDNATAVNVIGNANSNIFGTFMGLSLVSNPTATTGLVTLGIDDSGDTDSPGHGGPDELGPLAISGSANLTDHPAVLTPYQGVGSLSTVGLMTLAGYGVVGGGGNVDVNVNTRARALLRVTYTYDAAILYDLGDNPDNGTSTGTGSYNTINTPMIPRSGARHLISGPYLGNCVDADSGSLQNGTARADDDDPGLGTTGSCVDGNDEDGVILPASVLPGSTGNVLTIRMPGGAFVEDCVVRGWIDFNRNGVFTDAGEEVVPSQSFGNGSGDTPVTFAVPAGASLGTTYARFRCASSAVDGPVGDATSGEVEDYLITIGSWAVPVPLMGPWGLALLALLLPAVARLRRPAA